eukprot:2767228-Pyramimonas_sp.AAC.1
MAITIANVAALARLEARTNKYVLWTTVAAALPALRGSAEARVWYLLVPFSTAALLWRATLRDTVAKA